MPDEATTNTPVPVPPTPPVVGEQSAEEVTRQMTEELQEILGSAAPVTPDAMGAVVGETPAEAPATAPAPVVLTEAPVAPAQPEVIASPVVAPVPPVAPIIAPTEPPVAPVPSPAPAPQIAPELPPTPPASSVLESDTAHHQAMGQKLGLAIESGKHEVPASPAPLVCRPQQLESWRVFKIMSEFVEGFELIGKYGLAASFFGTSRASFASRYYEEATQLAGLLAKDGYAIITGGSDGIMGAANKGAFEAGGASVGLNIELGDNQGLNQYLTDSMTFHHFFARKVMLAYASDVYIYFPGGYGTLDEFTELLTLVQTKKIKRIPIVLYGKEYWTPLVEFFTNKLNAEYHAIDPDDLELYRLVDTVEEAHAYIKESVTSC